MRESERVRSLEGNGVTLVRERELASRVQAGLERLYQLDRVAHVEDYVTHAGDGERETLLVREAHDGLEISLRLPRLAHAAEASLDTSGLDSVCQIIEGVSHFVAVTERASRGREVSALELELQAEVDKYVVLASSLGELTSRSSEALRAKLFERVAYAHDEGTEHGERYRVASRAAHRLVHAMERRDVARGAWATMRSALRSFYRMPLSEKLRVCG